jgi:ABC-type transporter Mla MlaB component
LTEPESGAVSPARMGPPSLSVGGRLGPERVAELCARVRSTAESRPDDPLHCNVERLDAADMACLDALARMALAARRLGRGLELDGARADLRGLIALAGLVEVLRCDDELEAADAAELRRGSRRG